MKPQVILTDLVSVKYSHQSEETARVEGQAKAKQMLNAIVKAVRKGARASFVCPDSLIASVPPRWTKEPVGQAYKSQGILEQVYLVRTFD